MNRTFALAILSFFVLAACGIDGEPVQPSLNAGIGISSGGANVYGGVGLHQGPVSLFVGF